MWLLLAQKQKIPRKGEIPLSSSVPFSVIEHDVGCGRERIQEVLICLETSVDISRRYQSMVFTASNRVCVFLSISKTNKIFGAFPVFVVPQSAHPLKLPCPFLSWRPKQLLEPSFHVGCASEALVWPLSEGHFPFEVTAFSQDTPISQCVMAGRPIGCDTNCGDVKMGSLWEDQRCPIFLHMDLCSRKTWILDVLVPSW